MKVFQTTAGIPVVISEFESQMLSMCSDWISLESLEEFEKNLVDKMISRDLLLMNEDGTKIKTQELTPLWRI